MEEEILNIQDAIIEKEKFEDYECQICFSIALKPVECRGPCHKKFCSKCVSDWKMQQDRCPLKCSQPFFVRPTENPPVTFKCPYSPSCCPVILKNITEFETHFTECQYISEKQSHDHKLKQECKCFQEHELEFFLGTYEEMCESTCASCKEIKLCREICRKCNELYCVFCRPPLCSKKGCPLGHRLNYQQWNQVGYICDMCGVSTSITNRGVYDDPVCNFGLCEECYSELPEEHSHSLQPKNPYMCNKNHELIIELPQKEKRTCMNCEKEKYCPKTCELCSESYCIECKTGIITETRQCHKSHRLEYQTYNYNELLIEEEQQEKEKQKECIKCNNTLTSNTCSYYFDPICQFAICEICYEYEGRILDNKSRFIEEHNCNNGHLLKYYSGEEEYVNQCCNCYQNKVIRLFCDCCPPDQRTYCCECKAMTNNKVCYFGHDLDEVEEKLGMHCNKCGNIESKIRKCFKCNYSICLECYDGNEKKQHC